MQIKRVFTTPVSLLQSTFPAKMLIKLFKLFFALVKSLFNIV